MRRAVLLVALALAWLPAGAAFGAAGTDQPRDLAFTIWRGTTPVGHHRISFRREGDEIHAEVEIAIDVRLLWAKVFSYHQRSHEVWRGGRLVALDSETNDSGEAFRLRVRAAGDGLVVETAQGTRTVPGDVLPASYWHPDSPRQAVFLGTKRGRLLPVSVTDRGVERLRLGDREIAARRYSVQGKRDFDIWYGVADGRWLKLEYASFGLRFVYLPDGVVPDAATSALAAER